ncbi:TBC1 domain family protein [Tritrichomonas foetus]|uniref:TBC1 domain family protein n=1 Tax=Tritrichomonas foetus TaxID=1144522 RepID=A0A1J4KBE0_9EUKA|nr:TBC1 domain family protein [Tritrichomonas foetus]|eukprot:OHT08729.1 TBC1 domain family protein [Tritrichomonas foetus]
MIRNISHKLQYRAILSIHMEENDDNIPRESPQFLILPLVQPGQDDSIDTNKIRELTALGLDYAQPEDRCLAWLVLLGIYPKNAKQWPETLQELVTLYQTYVDVCNIGDWLTKRFEAHITDIEVFGVGDNAMMALIHGDIVRTGRHIYLLPCTDDDGSSSGSVNLYAGHLRRLERILYILGNINKNMSYMQGFNELAVPFYYVTHSAKSLFEDDFVAEAVSFHMLHQLVSSTEMKDLFTTDDRSSILLGKLDGFNTILEKHVPQAFKIITEYKIPCVCYCYRWFSLMFSQEYTLPELLQIWDSLFTQFENIVDYEFYVGAAQIDMVMDDLVGKDYPETLEILQNIKIRNIYQLLSKANQWWRKDHDPTLIEAVASTVSNAVKGFMSKLNQLKDLKK